MRYAHIGFILIHGSLEASVLTLHTSFLRNMLDASPFAQPTMLLALTIIQSLRLRIPPRVLHFSALLYLYQQMQNLNVCVYYVRIVVYLRRLESLILESLVVRQSVHLTDSDLSTFDLLLSQSCMLEHA